MSKTIRSISDVVEKQLCTGCGGCAYVEPTRYYMGDALEYGRRPFVRPDAPAESGEGLAICPGVELKHDEDLRGDPSLIPQLLKGWGPVFGVWEGYAADDAIRFSGSSGGAATALALYSLEKEGMAGVLHSAARHDVPYLNETVMSANREELLTRTGSRYSPASPVEGLGRIEQARGKCVFIGKPCDVAAVHQARKIRPVLDDKLGLTIGFFCAGVPSVQGTLALFNKLGIADPAKVTELRYRGKGWPGLWTARYQNAAGVEQVKQLTYADSWGFLQKYRQWRCYICPDHTGEFADIAVGDPWYREVQPGELGKSLIVARTKRGVEAILAAAEAGYLILETYEPDLLPRSQPNLLATRGALWARLWVLRILGAAVPNYSGFHMFKFWLRNLDSRSKLQSFTGTVKRIFTKRLRKQHLITEWFPDKNS